MTADSGPAKTPHQRYLFGAYQLETHCVGNMGKAILDEILGVFSTLCKLYSAVLLFETLLAAH